jgi:alcohol dehydrogenase (NADP+)
MMKQLLFKNGDVLPNLGLGTWLSKRNEVYDAVIAALKCGYRHIDCAYIYGNEAEIGKALQSAFETGIVKREELFITSKLWNSDHAPERVELAIRRSLKDLQLEYLDLYLIHWPVAFKTGHEQAKTADDLISLAEMPLIETWKAFEEIQKTGLTKHIGVSNFNIPKLKQLITNATIAPEVNQVELHPYLGQQELVDYCAENSILLTAYSPLGSHHLINSQAGLTREKVVIVMAERNNCTPAQILLAWGMQRGISVIPKSTNAERIKENFESVNVRLSVADFDKVSGLERNYRNSVAAFCVLPNGSYTAKSIWEE